MALAGMGKALPLSSPALELVCALQSRVDEVHKDRKQGAC